ncbi:MAG TPA: BMC domain-containing protein [Polyangia bacterium]|jgi:microcompartment protein CcmL/EutN
MSEALALIELSSIARGYQVADAVVKKAPVVLRDCRPVSPGKFLVLFDGDVASVDEAFRRGIEVAGDRLVDKLFLPQAHPQLGPAVRGESNASAGVESYAVVETLSVAAALLAADAAAKAAAVRLVEMQLARGIGGKAFFSLSGPLADIEAAVDAAIGITDRALLLGTEIIPAPHEDFLAKLP